MFVFPCTMPPPHVICVCLPSTAFIDMVSRPEERCAIASQPLSLSVVYMLLPALCALPALGAFHASVLLFLNVTF